MKLISVILKFLGNLFMSLLKAGKEPKDVVVTGHDKELQNDINKELEDWVKDFKKENKISGDN